MKYVWEPSAANPQKPPNPHFRFGRVGHVQEYGQRPSPTDYANPRTIRPYSRGQNAEWDVVSRMLAAGLVTVSASPDKLRARARVIKVDNCSNMR